MGVISPQTQDPQGTFTGHKTRLNNLARALIIQCVYVCCVCVCVCVCLCVCVVVCVCVCVCVCVGVCVCVCVCDVYRVSECLLVYLLSWKCLRVSHRV